MKLPYSITKKQVALAVVDILRAYEQDTVVHVLGKKMEPCRFVCPSLSSLQSKMYLPWNAATVEVVREQVRKDLQGASLVQSRVGLYLFPAHCVSRMPNYSDKVDAINQYLEEMEVPPDTHLHRAARSAFEYRCRQLSYDDTTAWWQVEQKLRVQWMLELAATYDD